jgi:hypothetical protein
MNKVKVSVPESAGEKIRIAYGGAKPVEYKVTGGHVEVDAQHVDAFLRNVEGAKVDAGNTGSTSTKKEDG